MRLWTLSAFALIAPLAACSADDAPIDDDAIAAVATKQGGTVDLISPSTCSLGAGRLRNCRIDTRVITAIAEEQAVPVRTTIRRVATGNCSTQFPLAVQLSAPEAVEPRTLAFLSEPAVVLRAPHGAPLSKVTVADASSWTRTATFDGTCNIRLQVELNQPDVETLEQAQAALAQIDLALVDARERRDSYQQLLLFHGGHEFLQRVVDDLYVEVNSDMMQRLREAYVASSAAFRRLGDSEVCTKDLAGAAGQILDVADAMFILGDPGDWLNPDGTRKTLADLYTELGGAGVLAQIDELVRTSDPALEQRYQDLYNATALQVVQLEHRRALAVIQLAPWLEATP